MPQSSAHIKRSNFPLALFYFKFYLFIFWFVFNSLDFPVFFERLHVQLTAHSPFANNTEQTSKRLLGRATTVAARRRERERREVVKEEKNESS